MIDHTVITALLLSVPTGFLMPYINMHKCAVQPNPALIWHEELCIGRHIIGRYPFYHNICGIPFSVPGTICATYILVMRVASISRSNSNWFAEMLSNLL